ncbi:MAG TPA: hypothetical protein VLZ74_11990 [Methylocella sp.]|nr:hypothetical protein [Methylocella sp.]
MKALWLSLGTALILSQTAVAGHLTRSERMQQSGATEQQPLQPSQPLQQAQDLSQQLRTNLQKSGFSNVRIMPESFLIRAQDPQGNPIEMVVSPTSIAAVDVGRWNGSPLTGRSAAEQSAPRFMRGPVYDAMNANLADTNVQSSDQQNVGAIKGIAIGEDGSLSYVLTINGNRDVAVNPAAMSLSYDATSDKWNANVNATKKQIDSAPQVQYNDKSQ